MTAAPRLLSPEEKREVLDRIKRISAPPVKATGVTELTKKLELAIGKEGSAWERANLVVEIAYLVTGKKPPFEA